MGNTATPQEMSRTLSKEDTVSLPIPSFSDHDNESGDDDEEQSSMTMSSLTPHSRSHNEHSYAFGLGLDEALPPQIADCWNAFHPQRFARSKTKPSTIHRISKPSATQSQLNWLSVFGTLRVRSGQHKVWQVAITPRFAGEGAVKPGDAAEVVLGVCDAETTRDCAAKSKYKRYGNGAGFWKAPFFGFACYGFNGKKFHGTQRGKAYGPRFRVGDVITIELDMQCNAMALSLSVNGRSSGMAFRVEEHRE